MNNVGEYTIKVGVDWTVKTATGDALPAVADVFDQGSVQGLAV